MKNIKITILYPSIFSLILAGLACDKDLKEHPMPVSLKRRMEMQNDPEVLAKKVSGKITISNSPRKKPLTGTLFVFARPIGQEDGPPLAVKRIRNATFPFTYSIGQIDTMLPGADFTGEVQITARLDGDGLAGSGQGDLEGKTTARVGSENIDILLGEPLRQKPIPADIFPPISGTLDIAEDMKANIPENPFLFIYARSTKSRPGGPPIAAKRLQGIKFPYKFSISDTDIMIPGSKIVGDLEITARLDADGDAKAAPGDVKGRVIASTGETGIVLILDKIVPSKTNLVGAKSKTIKGIITVSSELQNDLEKGVDRLFIILRQKGLSGAPPMAVQLHKNIKFPLSFEIGQKDAMMPGTLVEGDVEIIVRVDRDGNAKASPGDLEGDNIANVGDDGINITLNKRL